MTNPTFVLPMLATRVFQLPTGPAWQYEVKWDGYRIQAVKQGSRVELFSRRGANYSDKFKSVAKAVTAIHADAAVLDGEVVATAWLRSSCAEKGPMVIRRYNYGEEGAVWKVYFAATRESIARDYHADLVNRWAPHDQDMSQWADRLAQKNPFVAVVDEEIVGMAEIEPDGFIDYLYVHPRRQNRGIGKALLATLESEAAKLGLNVITADVSITAKAFFLSRGFRITEAKSNIILGHAAPNFRMQKTLSSEPDGQANRSQPIGSETNKTSSATGSRR